MPLAAPETEHKRTRKALTGWRSQAPETKARRWLNPAASSTGNSPQVSWTETNENLTFCVSSLRTYCRAVIGTLSPD